MEKQKIRVANINAFESGNKRTEIQTKNKTPAELKKVAKNVIRRE